MFRKVEAVDPPLRCKGLFVVKSNLVRRQVAERLDDQQVVLAFQTLSARLARNPKMAIAEIVPIIHDSIMIAPNASGCKSGK